MPELDALNRIADEIYSSDFDSSIVTDVLRHVKGLKKDICSEEPWISGHGKGFFLEYYTYELVKSKLGKSSNIMGMIRKGADLSNNTKKNSSTCKEGLCYNGKGDIVIRGNGIDLAELDLVVFASDGSVVLIEVMNTGNNLAYEAKEIEHKKRLLRNLLRRRIYAIVASAEDLSQKAVIKDITSDRENRFVWLRAIPEVNCDMLNNIEIARSEPIETKKLIYVDQVKQAKSSTYEEKVKKESEYVLDSLRKGRSFSSISDHLVTTEISNIWLFRVSFLNFSQHLGSISFHIKKRKVLWEDLGTCFSSAIIGLSMSYLRPTVYWRIRKKKKYLKFVPFDHRSFKLAGILPHTDHTRPFSLEPYFGVDNEETYKLVDTLITTFYRPEISNLKRTRLISYNKITNLCPVLSAYIDE